MKQLRYRTRPIRYATHPAISGMPVQCVGATNGLIVVKINGEGRGVTCRIIEAN